MFDYIRLPQGNIISQPNFSQFLPQGQRQEINPKTPIFWIAEPGNQMISEPGNDMKFN